MGEWGPSSRGAAPQEDDWSPEWSPPAAPKRTASARPAPKRPGEPVSARPPVPAPKPVAVGEWLWACRAGSESDLCDELSSHGLTGRVVQSALIASASRPRNQHKEDIELAFARQGLPVQALLAADAEVVAAHIAKLTADRRFTPEGSGLALHVFSPDSDEGNQRAAAVLALSARLGEALSAREIPLLADGKTAHTEGGRLIQVCLLDEERVALGVLPARAAPSLFPGGRQRYKKPKDAPARSALKLVEALAWLGHGPQSGEVCVDLGAAPGGWSQVLLERRCHVVAIDPGSMAPHLRGRLEHLRMNAFTFAPEIPADWVLCDMAYRPLEVAGLLAKWGRHRWAQFLLANIKLPMNRRVDMLARVREILATGGWTGLRVRQLYHDRDEVTLSAWRGFGIDTRVPQHRTAHGAGPSEYERPTDSDSGRAAGRGRNAGFPGKKTAGKRSERATDATPGRAPARGRTGAPTGKKSPARRSERATDATSGRAPTRGRTGAPTGKKSPARRSERPAEAPAGRAPRADTRGRPAATGPKKPAARAGRPARSGPPTGRNQSPRPRR